MTRTVDQLLLLVGAAINEAAPDGFKKNTILRHLGQLRSELGDYRELPAQNIMSDKGREALARAEREGKLWARKDCGC